MNYKVSKNLILTLILLNGCFASLALATDTAELEAAIQKGDEMNVKQILKLKKLSKDEQTHLLTLVDSVLAMRKTQVEANHLSRSYNDINKELILSVLSSVGSVAMMILAAGLIQAKQRGDPFLFDPNYGIAGCLGTSLGLLIFGFINQFEYDKRFVYLYEKTARIKQLIYKVHITPA